MADWENVEPDEYKYLGQNYTSGRPWGIQSITIHHMAGDLDADDCNRIWRNAGTSAHYSIDRNGWIVQHVDDGDRAWACGDGLDWGSPGNDCSISIEHANNNSDPWTVYDAAIESGAHLVAALCKAYGLGRPEWMVNVFPHSARSATACPGELAGSQNAQYMKRAQEWYDAMVNGGEVTPAPGGDAPVSPTPAPTPAPAPSGNIPDVRYCVCTENNGWLSEMVNHQDTGGSGDTFAGDGSPITYLAIDMPGWYQVCTTNQGWLPKVYNYDPSDLENGCAGDGSPITSVRCYYETQDPDSTGWLGIKYAVANAGENFLSDMIDLEDTGGSGDDYAGNGGSISAFQAELVRV